MKHMKHMKMLGLAAITALGLMAFLGAGSASATTLFTNSAKTISYPTGTTVHLTLKSGTSVTVRDTSLNLVATCIDATTHGATTNQTGSAVVISISTRAWGGCNQTTDTINGGSLSITWTSGTSGTVTDSGSNVTLQVFGVSCTYGTGEGTTLGTITGGEAPELAINAPLTKTAGGFLCPSWVLLFGTYIVTSPHALFVGP